MTVAVTKRIAKMKLGDITLKPDKKTGWWCLVKRYDVYAGTAGTGPVADKLNAAFGTSYGIYFTDVSVLGKVASQVRPHWRGVAVGLKDRYFVYPSYGNDLKRLHNILTKEEYETLISTNHYVPSVGYIKYIGGTSQYKYAFKENNYVRLPFKPSWIAFSELDNTPLESLK